MEIEKNEASEAIPHSAQGYLPAKCVKFDPLWVQVLINLRTKHSKMFTRRRNSASEGWKLVYDELKQSGAPDYVTVAKIKKKWMNLMTRYRQIKNTTLNPEAVSWPYFEQIDRAFGKECEAEDEKGEALLNQSVSNDERQSFIKRLIELRYNHRHLFTGRKYTARDGWLIIQSLLQCQGKYSIDQLSKCWQNLVQRYKQLSKVENAENITWPYFEHMNKLFLDDGKAEHLNVTASETTSHDVSSMEGEDKSDNNEAKQTVFNVKNATSVSVDCILIQLLTEIKAAQESNHKEVMGALRTINDNLTVRNNNDINANDMNDITENVAIAEECIN